MNVPNLEFNLVIFLLIAIPWDENHHYLTTTIWDNILELFPSIEHSANPRFLCRVTGRLICFDFFLGVSM